MKALLLLVIVIGVIFLAGSGCRPETTGAVTACSYPEVQLDGKCCIDFDENKICDEEQSLGQSDGQSAEEQESAAANTSQATQPVQPAEQPVAQKTEEAQKTYTIEIRDFKYSPSELEIKKGDTVVWLNKEDEMPHAVYEINGKFRKDRFMPGESFSFTFTEEGEYIFADSYQKFMRGKITVK